MLYTLILPVDCLRPRTDGAADPLVSSLSTEHVVFLCMLRVLAVFGLNATLIFSLIIIIIIIIMTEIVTVSLLLLLLLLHLSIYYYSMIYGLCGL